MQYRRFGRTELKIPVFSCGGMRYQHSWTDSPRWKIPADNQRNLEATIRRAFELGINHIETARGYGTSEVQLGQILPALPRDRLIVQTKIVPKDNPQDFSQKLQKSLSNLKLECVDLLALHGINTPELLEACVRSRGYLDEARKFQQQGRVRFIGFSTHGPTNVIIDAIETNQFDYVNLHWYYINQFNWAAIEAAQRHDMGVFIISPSDKGGKLYKPPQKLVELCQPLSPMVFNDLFCLSHPQVHTLSLGAANPSDFDEHLKTLPLLERSGEILPPILERLQQEAIACFGKDWVNSWHLGLPTPETTPNEINIKMILWLRNLAIAYDLVEYAKGRYNLLGNGGHWFPGFKAEDVEKLDLSQCLAGSPYATEIPTLLAETHQMLAEKSVKRLSQP